MRLTAKLVAVFVLGIMVLIAINGYLAIRRETQLFAQDAADDAERLGSAMETIWATSSPMTLRTVVWPKRSRSPVARVALPVRRLALMKVPFLEPRSSTWTSPPATRYPLHPG